MSDIASRAEEAADIALGAAGVAVKAGKEATEAVESIPKSDPLAAVKEKSAEIRARITSRT